MSVLSHRITRRTLLAAGLALLAACSDSTTEPTPTPTPGGRFTAAVAFGASLEDTGNACNASLAACPPVPYAPGKYSNGPLWAELVAKQYGTTLTPVRTGGTNYAYAGARTGAIAGTTQLVPNMNQQVDTYLASGPTAGRATTLFIIGGATVGNDINDALVQGAANPQVALAILNSAVTNIVGQINRLYAGGARNILVANSTDIGRTPQVRAQGALAIAAATQLSAQFNAGLASQLATIRSASPGLNLYLLDFGALTAEIFANPSTFGFTNTTQACVAGTTVCSAPDTYLYWDSFHPTAATGRAISARAITVVGP